MGGSKVCPNPFNKGFSGGNKGGAGSGAVEKGYGRSTTASHAMGVRKITLPTGPALGWAPPTIAEEHDPKDQPQLAEGPPWLIAHPLFDGDSTLLNEFFQSRIHDLGEASGKRIFFWDIGNPRQHDAWYEEVVSKELKARGEKDADEYQKEIDKLGKEEHYILREVKILREALGVRPGEVPCIAFRTQPMVTPVPILRIKQHWYVTPEARTAFSKTLQEWLPIRGFAGLTRAGIMNDELARRLNEELEKLSGHIEEQVEAALKRKTEPPIVSKNTFKKEGSVWTISYEGKTVRYPESVGLIYIALLLTSPHQEIHALKLRGVASGLTDDEILESAGYTISEEEVRSRRLEGDDIQEELRRAKASRDLAEAGALQARLEENEEQLGRARGSADGITRVADDGERARKSIAAAISRALEKFKMDHPDLWRHLKNSLKFTTFCTYAPEREVDWET